MDLAALKGELVRDEGLVLKMYPDTSIPPKHTIGVGHNLDAVPITYAAAMQILEDDIMAVMGQLNANIPWWATLNDTRQRVLANMCFNLGINGLLGFHHLLANGEAGNFNDEDLLDSKWAKQVGARAIRLAQMWKTGLS